MLCFSLFQTIEAEDTSLEKGENAVSVKKSESELEQEESLMKGLRRRSTRGSMKKPGEKNDDADMKNNSPVSIFAELLVNFSFFLLSVFMMLL